MDSYGSLWSTIIGAYFPEDDAPELSVCHARSDFSVSNSINGFEVESLEPVPSGEKEKE